MTPRERAELIHLSFYSRESEQMKAIEEAITAAIEEERAKRRKNLDNEDTWAPGDYADQIADGYEGCTISKADGSYDRLKKDVISAIEEYAVEQVEAEREACARIAETIRKRELALYKGMNPYFTVAEEIRDRIQMRPATSNKDWSELKGNDP